MSRRDQTRAERLAWARAFGRPLSDEDRALLRETDDSQQVERITEGVRRLTHGDRSAATGAERRALFDAVMERRGAEQPSPRRLAIVGWAGAAVAAAIALLVIIPWGAGVPTSDGPQEHVAVRGTAEELPVVGLGISGVDADGAEYEVVHGDGVCASDALRLYLTARDARTPHFVVFGIQDIDDPTWYAPAPRDTAAPRIPEVPALAWVLPFEIVVDGTHAPGPVSVVCILSEEPIHFSALEAAWRDADGDDVSARAANAAALLADHAVRVLVEEIEVLEDCGRRP